ncbi:MAG: hypothetical protein EOS04_15475 [Mesorhizobium sp.]|nr:MAG: hypothetical protein EOR98_01715 [Mesorhizobium sp.]RWN83570.1 MAG: hypothetical protein EOS01_04630 [Mesorhizobium sp.]RWN87683.1 MAG: hypothetical protein EOS04_15475 [Mesorhizobium sp.]RWO16641.1 MAG: hypothetical protein EOS15_06665 [Mesorhizobium sp.]RWO73967.1 MAG: hypothetical protein EOS16_01395 [Mesorhizobium sp.]
MLIAQRGGGGELFWRAGRVPPLSCRTSPPQGGRLDAATASANLERQRRLRARQTVAFGFLVFLTGAGGAALRPRPIAFANCEREAA